MDCLVAGHQKKPGLVQRSPAMGMLVFLTVVLAFFFIGCAHQPAEQPSDAGGILSAPPPERRDEAAAAVKDSITGAADAQAQAELERMAAEVERDEIRGGGAVAPKAEDELEKMAAEVERDEIRGAGTGPPESSDEDDEFADEFDLEEEETAAATVPDYLEPWNRAMFFLNDKFYFYLLKPATRGYRAVVPSDFRLAIKNFFHNLGAPVRFVSSLLQGEGRKAVRELGAFFINSTLGVFGFGDPATRDFGIQTTEEDLGQTLGAWGFGEGLYIVWPLLGPSTLRDTVGLVGGYFLDPVTYVDPIELSLGVRAGDVVNDTSFSLGDYESLKDVAIDPYEAFRDAYIQLRRKRIKE